MVLDRLQGWWDSAQRWWDVWFVPFVPEGLPEFPRNATATAFGVLFVGLLAGDRLGIGRLRGTLWLLLVLAPLPYTLSATGSPGGLECSIGLTPWQFPGALLAPESRTNILMLVPAGAAAFLFPLGARRIAALGAALSLPLVIELTQRVWSHLGRSCQVFDVVNNMLGVLVGFWLVAGAVAMWESWQRIGSAGDGS